jgi:cytochrome oxidase Cu insertion factor (SCO1/SenC/PrrC family)
MEAGAGLGDGVPRPGSMAILAVVLGAVVIGVAAGVGAHLLSASHTSSPAARPSTGLDGEATWAAGQRAAPAINTLHDQSGHLFSLASLHGRPVAMEFFDSHCKQACPLAGRALAAAERSVAPAQRPALVVVSVNPLDTPASTRAAIRSRGLAGLAPWYWLRGTHAQLAPVWSAYHIFVQPMRGGHHPHRGSLPDRPPWLRALRIPVSLHPVPRGPRHADAGGPACIQRGSQRRMNPSTS